MAKQEWILGQPENTQTVYEWSLGMPVVSVDGTVGGAVNAPTGHLAGPLWGPMAGPVFSLCLFLCELLGGIA